MCTILINVSATQWRRRWRPSIQNECFLVHTTSNLDYTAAAVASYVVENSIDPIRVRVRTQHLQWRTVFGV